MFEISPLSFKPRGGRAFRKNVYLSFRIIALVFWSRFSPMLQSLLVVLSFSHIDLVRDWELAGNNRVDNKSSVVVSPCPRANFLHFVLLQLQCVLNSTQPCSLEIQFLEVSHIMETPVSHRNRLSMDEVLPMIGEFGKFQILLEIAFCIMIFPVSMLVLIPYFAQHNPPWQCVNNSTICPHNGTFGQSDDLYSFRCDIPRSEWEFTKPKDYSIMTEVSTNTVASYLYMVIRSHNFSVWLASSSTQYTLPWGEESRDACTRKRQRQACEKGIYINFLIRVMEIINHLEETFLLKPFL